MVRKEAHTSAILLTPQPGIHRRRSLQTRNAQPWTLAKPSMRADWAAKAGTVAFLARTRHAHGSVEGHGAGVV